MNVLRFLCCLSFAALLQYPSLVVSQENSNKTTESATDTGSEPPETVQGTIISRDVIVEAGDTFVSISRRELGSGSFAAALSEFNRQLLSSTLAEGSIVRIPILVPAREEAATVIFVKGQVTRAGLDIGKDAEIRRGDVLITGPSGFVSLEFSSGSIVNLQPDTSATLIRLNCLPDDDSCLIELHTDKGQMSSDVETREGQPVEFRVTTPYASAAVRGTAFKSIVDGPAFVVGVTEGAVNIEAQQAAVALDKGFGSVTQDGSAPGDPVPLLPPPAFRNIPTRLASGDAVLWFGLTDAARYHVTVSSDNQGNQVVASFNGEENHLDIAGAVDAGNYYLYLHGMDSNGIPGYQASTRISVADIDDSIAPVNTSISRDGQEFLVQVIDPPDTAPGFEIQLSDNPAFDDPLSVDVSGRGSAVFRVDDETVYARARILLDPLSVSAFGKASSSR
ncbi:MAG: FecR family protein [Granulosicoccus sp.]